MGFDRRLRPTLRDAADAGASLLATALGLGVAVWWVDGVTASLPALLLCAGLVGVLDLLARPVLRLVALFAGAVGALAGGLGVQVLVVWGAVSLVPGVEVASWSEALLLVLVTSVVMAVGRWAIGANDSAYVLGDVLRRARSTARRTTPNDPGMPGMLVVQLDGVSRDVLLDAIDAGLAPTMARWIDEGTHLLAPWWARVPSTTPASQAGLLHGDSSQIPAFRWWDKSLGRLVVTNHPADAHLVERRISDGNGLLAHDGVAISTMFTGDAPTSLLVMSRTRGHGGLGPGQPYLRFFARPFVLVRAVVMTVAEMGKELYQGRRQRIRGVKPRVERHGAYVLLRGVTNVLLRDLNTALIAEHMMKGARVVFVDLVDYDEIAHHAGPSRPESLRALEGLDRVLWILQQVVAAAPRDYRLVVLSDHGQSLGTTFEQVERRSLLEAVTALMSAAPVTAVQARAGEEWGPLNALLASTFGGLETRPAPVLGPDGERAGEDDHEPVTVPEVAVIASGNLGMVWFPRVPGRLSLEDIQDAWPDLVPGLAQLPAIGLVVATTAARGVVAVGPKGLHLLTEGTVEGEDPLAGYPSRAAADLVRVATLAPAGDLVLVSSVDQRGRVHAFEGLVGSHGGLGGSQNDALLLHPAEWAIDADLLEEVDGRAQLVGAEAVHTQLVRWLQHLGLRP